MLDTFHPLTNEMFMSLAAIFETRRELNELLQYGDIAPRTWSGKWQPFLDNGAGLAA